MMNIIDNKYALLKLKPKKPKLLILIFIFIILIFILLWKVKVYDNYETRGYVSCNNSCTVTTFIPTDLNFQEIYMKNKMLDYEIISSSVKVDQQNLISYLELNIMVKENLKNEEIINLNFYYQKQRLITKLRNLMF